MSRTFFTTSSKSDYFNHNFLNLKFFLLTCFSPPNLTLKELWSVPLLNSILTLARVFIIPETKILSTFTRIGFFYYYWTRRMDLALHLRPSSSLPCQIFRFVSSPNPSPISAVLFPQLVLPRRRFSPWRAPMAAVGLTLRRCRARPLSCRYLPKKNWLGGFVRMPCVLQ
jgi:hypothetical protein